MTLQDIPRHKAGMLTTITESTDGLNTERAKLATRAKDLLGYAALDSDVRGALMLGSSSGQLTETLLKLEMDVLDSAEVVNYQVEEMRRRTKEAILDNFEHYVAGWFSPAIWQHTELSQYKRPIPEFVIDKAVRIKETLPEVKFFVQHLTDPKADPFLVAKVGGEIYYIDAWDEPRFERGL